MSHIIFGYFCDIHASKCDWSGVIILQSTGFLGFSLLESISKRHTIGKVSVLTLHTISYNGHSKSACRVLLFGVPHVMLVFWIFVHHFLYTWLFLRENSIICISITLNSIQKYQICKFLTYLNTILMENHVLEHIWCPALWVMLVNFDCC